MAVTKIIPIRTTIGKSVDYICNPNKTENCAFVYSVNCFPKTASVEFFSSKASKNKRSYHEIQDLSDSLCRENGLSVIEIKSGKRGKSRFEYDTAKQGGNYKEKLRLAIDNATLKANIFLLNIKMASDLQEPIPLARTTPKNGLRNGLRPKSL